MTPRSFLAVSTIWLALAGVAPAQAPPDRTSAGRFVVEHPTLHSLGFEWAIDGDANRNASVDVSFRAVGDHAWRPALPLVRIGGEQVYRRREHLDYTVPHGFAGSILGLQPGTEYRVPLRPRRSRRRRRGADRDRARPDARRAATVHGRPHAPRLSARSPGAERGAQLHQPAARLLRRRARRLERRARAAGAARRHHRRARRTVPAGAAELRRSADGAVRRDVRPDARRHRRLADHDHGRRRWRGGLRRRRQPRALRRDGHAPSHLRRSDDPQHRRRHAGRPQGRDRCRGADGQELPVRAGRLRRLDRVRRLERLLPRRQPVPRPRRSLPTGRLDRAAVGQRRARTARTCSPATTRSRSTGPATSSPATPSPTSTTASASRPTGRRSATPSAAPRRSTSTATTST